MKKMFLPHSLLEQGIATSLTNDQIGPLYDDNGNKEGSVTCILKSLTLLISLETIKVEVCIRRVIFVK